MNKKCFVSIILLLLSATTGHGLVQKAPGTEQVTITVTDQQGNALSNLKVIEMVSMQEYTTDENGRFTCDLSNETRYFYSIDKERKLVNSGRLQPGKRQLQVQLEPGRIVTGKVIDTNGRPVPGAKVGALPMSPWCVLSDEGGKFNVGWLPKWEPRNGLCLMARSVERNLAAIVDISRQTESIEIELIPALTLSGLVTNQEDVPISGVRLDMSLKKWTWGCGIPVKDTLTDDNGQFRFQALPQLQEYELRIIAKNYLGESFTIGLLNTIKETEEIAPIILNHKQDTTNGIEQGQLFVNVFDKGGKPIDITEVQIWKKRDDGRTGVKSFVVTSTDKPGLHKIKSIPAGRYHAISINEEGYAPYKQFDILIEKDSTNTINCLLSRGGIIEGQVVNEKGNPVEGMPVAIKSPLYRIGFMGDIITDANGRFYADYMPDMHYSIVAEPESESLYETTVFRGDVLCGQKDIKIIVQNKKGTRLGASLFGKNLPGFEGIKINLNPEQIQNKIVLICFFDMNQRPARNCILQLSKRAQELKAKDIVIVAVQASKIEKEKLDEWIKKNNITFPIGIIQGNPDEIQFNWSVQSLPWLILTDTRHVVITEGFALTELEKKITN